MKNRYLPWFLVVLILAFLTSFSAFRSNFIKAASSHLVISQIQAAATGVGNANKVSHRPRLSL